MSSLMDGINNAYLLTAQINALKAQSQTSTNNPETIKVALEQNFNKMLDDLISSTDDDKKKEEDIFSFFTDTNQTSLKNLPAQGIPDMSSSEYLNSLYNLGEKF